MACRDLECKVDGLCVKADFAIQCDSVLLVAGLFDHSKTKVQAAACKMGYHRVSFGYKTYQTAKEWYSRYYERVPMVGVRDNFYYALVVNERVGGDFIITTECDMNEDFYNYLMANFKLPLLKEWIPEIVSCCENNRYISREWGAVTSGSVAQLPLHGKLVRSDDIIVLSLIHI